MPDAMSRCQQQLLPPPPPYLRSSSSVSCAPASASRPRGQRSRHSTRASSGCSAAGLPAPGSGVGRRSSTAAADSRRRSEESSAAAAEGGVEGGVWGPHPAHISARTARPMDQEGPHLQAIPPCWHHPAALTQQQLHGALAAQLGRQRLKLVRPKLGQPNAGGRRGLQAGRQACGRGVAPPQIESGGTIPHKGTLSDGDPL